MIEDDNVDNSPEAGDCCFTRLNHLVMTNLRHRAVRYRLGLEDAESLVRIADALVDQGHLMPAAIELLIVESPDLDIAGPLFEKLCVELGMTLPTKDEAIDELLRFHLERIASGRCGALDGLNSIMAEVYRHHIDKEPITHYVGDSRGIHQLIGAYWGYYDLIGSPGLVSWEGKYGEAGIHAWEQSVRQYAEEWLQKHTKPANGGRVH